MTLPAQIDAAFLARVEQWRESLARHIARQNPALTGPQLHDAVQITINRLLFLRMCEERGIERHGQLMALAGRTEVYRLLLALFCRADTRYKSGLFYFKRQEGRSGVLDKLTPELVIDDEPFKDIIESLYRPQAPGGLSILPAEVLGQVYEQSLGRAITRIDDLEIRVEDRREVKRAGGIFYTPADIVDHIIRLTIGRLLEGRTVLSHKTRPPKLDRPLRVLDPACGSGAFLLSAYQHLLDWYRTYYVRHSPDTWAAADTPPIDETGTHGWRLTSAERKRILLDHIYGVDSDPQAVEITKLSLLLKALEGDPRGKARALVNLAGNLKCGNALIGPDFFEGPPPGTSDEPERRRVYPFDWPAEFPDIFHAGGFSAVIGNPPWGQKGIDLDDEIRDYLRSKYVSLAGILDIFRPFVERSINLLAPGGRFGMVLPDVVLLKDYPDTRLFMLQNLCLHDICWWGMAFGNAVIDAATIVGSKGRAPEGQRVRVRVKGRDHPLDHEILQSDFLANPRHTFNLHLTPAKRAVLQRLDRLPKLGDFFEVHEGIHSGNMRAELFLDHAADRTCQPLYFGRDEIAPYRLHWNGRYVRLGALPDTRNGNKYANLGRRHWHERPKVLVRRTGDHVLAAVDAEGLYASNNFFLVIPRRPCGLDLYGLCALLNSRFMTWYFRCLEPRQGRAFAELKIKHLRIFPLPNCVEEPGTDHELNRLGRAHTAETARLAQPPLPHLADPQQADLRHIDECIEACALLSLGLGADFRAQIT